MSRVRGAEGPPCRALAIVATMTVEATEIAARKRRRTSTDVWTRVLVSQGPDELLRAVLPPPSLMRHERSVATFLEGLALWLDPDAKSLAAFRAE